jgi:hypothetical protein
VNSTIQRELPAIPQMPRKAWIMLSSLSVPQSRGTVGLASGEVLGQEGRNASGILVRTPLCSTSLGVGFRASVCSRTGANDGVVGAWRLGYEAWICHLDLSSDGLMQIFRLSVRHSNRSLVKKANHERWICRACCWGSCSLGMCISILRYNIGMSQVISTAVVDVAVLEV